MTTWKPIPGHPDYEVSDDGQVRSWRKRGYGGGSDAAPRVLAQHVMPNGYAKVRVAAMVSHPLWVHRLVALAFHGPCPDGQEVRHVDGDRRNNRPSNLVYGTRSENNLDAVTHGTHSMTRKTACPAGHPYDDENTVTYTRTRGGRSHEERVCRTCQREHSRRQASRSGIYVPCETCGRDVSKSNYSRHRKGCVTQEEVAA